MKTPKKTVEEIVKAIHLMHDTTGIHPRRATEDELRHYGLKPKHMTDEAILKWGQEVSLFRTMFVPGAVFSAAAVTLPDGTVYKFKKGTDYSYPPSEVVAPKHKPKPRNVTNTTTITVNTSASPVNVDYGANGNRPVPKPTNAPIAPPRAATNAVAPATGFKAHRAKFTICGHTVTSVLRWMGFNYWSTSEARHILDQYAETRGVAEATINAQIRDGRNQSDGKKMSHGPVPELTNAQIEELYSKRPKEKEVWSRSTPASPKSTDKQKPVKGSTKTHQTENPSKKKGFNIPSRTVPTAGKPAKKKAKSSR